LSRLLESDLDQKNKTSCKGNQKKFEKKERKNKANQIKPKPKSSYPTHLHGDIAYITPLKKQRKKEIKKSYQYMFFVLI